MAPPDPLTRPEGRSAPLPKLAAAKPRALALALLLAAGALAAWVGGFGEQLSLERVGELGQRIEALGDWGPVAYVAGYVLLELVFFPALPLTILGGLAFGPVWGTVYVSIAATLSAALAFLVARHTLRGVVEGWVGRHPRVARIDAAVATHGWRILMVTRLVPLFPYNLQNYAYGLTRIGFGPYVLVTFVCMLPATAAFTLAGGALAEGGRDPRRMLVYLGVAGVLLLGVSLLPSLLARRSGAAADLLGPGRRPAGAAPPPGAEPTRPASTEGLSLSIVIPALREAANLASLLPELRAGCPDAEVIVVDGESDDGSAEVAGAVPGIRLVRAPRGRARQMNAGAAVARGETLLFLHADTRLPAGAPAAIAEALGDPAVVAGRFDVRFDHPGGGLRVVAWLMNWRSRLTGIATGDQGLFVRRRVFQAAGGYPDIPLMEDVELSRRLKRHGRLASPRLRVTTSARKWEHEGLWRTIALMWALRLLHFLGVAPERLHRWYYGADPRPPAPAPLTGSGPRSGGR